jgi:hypothetical protein
MDYTIITKSTNLKKILKKFLKKIYLQNSENKFFCKKNSGNLKFFKGEINKKTIK